MEKYRWATRSFSRCQPLCSASYFAEGIKLDLAEKSQPSLGPAAEELQKMAIARSKAEERYAQIQKGVRGLNKEIDAAAGERADKAARLRQLRLAKEAEDAAEKQAAKDIKASDKSAFKKPR
jgi:hypothetical protein